MRALLLNAHGVTEVALPDGDSADHLRVMYDLIGCQLVTSAGTPAPGHAAWVDDEGMLTAKAGTLVTEVDWYPQPLFGNLLITGLNEEGETTAATLTTADFLRHLHSCGVLLED